VSAKILLADEPTTSLDATVQIQILCCCANCSASRVWPHLRHPRYRVAVEIATRMRHVCRRIVEEGACAAVIRNPGHPYTKGLLLSRTHKGSPRRPLEAIPGAA